MDSFSQTPFGTTSFADNPEPRCACLLLLDCSGSMQGNPIEELNAGLITFKDELAADELAVKRVEVAVISFGGAVNVVTDFTTAGAFTPTTLFAGGETPMGAAINLGLDLLQARKQIYKDNGIAYYRPWVFLITDGAPTDEWSAAANRVHQGESAKNFSFFAVGVENANLEKLGQIAARPTAQTPGAALPDLFLWLSKSLGSVSQSKVGDTVPLENPTAPDGWAAV
ncbi:MAG: VWA domain-containing protein [Anaerolineales bacterium]|nr:VWA domain-containing protein [Anaerolineales bacterium]